METTVEKKQANRHQENLNKMFLQYCRENHDPEDMTVLNENGIVGTYNLLCTLLETHHGK